jgi:DNA-binding transcriptional LysR family regulator
LISIQAKKLFVRVVDLGSFSKAAVDAGIGQPSPTKLIAQLEEHLGSRLLYRNTHDVSPTEVGAPYYEKCKLIAYHVEDPLGLRFLRLNPKVRIELFFDDHIVDIVE